MQAGAAGHRATTAVVADLDRQDAEGNRGARFLPPLNEDELAFFDAVAKNESAVAEQGEGILAQMACSPHPRS